MSLLLISSGLEGGNYWTLSCALSAARSCTTLSGLYATPQIFIGLEDSLRLVRMQSQQACLQARLACCPSYKGSAYWL